MPGFSARSTQGPIEFEKLRGSLVVLFFHPADFTPVCTSEFVALARGSGAFARRDCRLVGLSVDSLHSDLAWLRAIYGMSGVKVDFPIIGDRRWRSLVHAA